MADEEELVGIYGILRHPLRVRILDLLAEGPSSFTELKSRLNVGVGKLYYHLDALGRMVTQDRGRHYLLTDDGRRVQRFLSSSRGRLLTTERPGEASKVAIIAFPKPLLASIVDAPLTYLPLALALVALEGWVAARVGLSPRLFFFQPVPTTNLLDFLMAATVGWLTAFALCSLLAWGLFKRGAEGSVGLLVGSSLASLPATAYLTLYGAIGARPWGLLGYALLVVMQVWALCLMATAVCLSKELRLDRALLISLLVFYANAAVILGRAS